MLGKGNRTCLQCFRSSTKFLMCRPKPSLHAPSLPTPRGALRIHVFRALPLRFSAELKHNRSVTLQCRSTDRVPPQPPSSWTPDRFGLDHLVGVLQITDGNVTRAARLAARNRTAFYKLLNRHQIDPSLFKIEKAV